LIGGGGQFGKTSLLILSFPQRFGFGHHFWG
jgi:hypothetical protein